MSARTIVRLLVDKNPLFLLSALLLLGGAWLTNQPGQDGGRDLGMLWRLFTTVQGYEVTLLAAAFALARRRGLERDVRGLGLLLVPFLMDVSCTNAVVAEHTLTWGTDALLVSLVVGLAAVKGRVAARLAGVTFDRPAWGALLLGPALVGAAPVLASYARHGGVDAGPVALGLGLGVAGFLGAVAAASRPDAGPVRAVGSIAAAVATFHALATTYGQTGDSLHVLGPVLVVLGPTLPRLLGAAAPAFVTTWSPLVLPIAGAIACAHGDLNYTVGGAPAVDAPVASLLGVSAWRIGLLGMGAVHASLLVGRGGLAPLLGVALALDLGLSGSTPAASFAAIGGGPTEPVALLAMFAFGVVRQAHPGLLAPPLVLAALLITRAAPTALPGVDVALGIATVGAGLLGWTHRTHGGDAAAARWRVLGAGLVWVPLHAAALVTGPDGLAPAIAQSSLVLLLGLAVLTRTRSHALPSLLFLLEGARAVTPSTSAGWGGVGLTLAFGVVGLGVALSLQRERLLAWLDAPDAPDADAPRPTRDWAASGRSAVHVALALLAVGVTAGSASRSGKFGLTRLSTASATGSLRSIATAEVLFQEGDKDGDGVPDFGSLRDLGKANLIDASLASGERHGYRFLLVTWAGPTRHRWTAVARPLEPVDASGYPNEWLRIDERGQVERSTSPLSLPTEEECVAGGPVLGLIRK